MNDYIDTREGWREVRADKAIYPYLAEFSAEGIGRYWVREEPVPPLPTEPYTVIRVTWKPGHGHQESTSTVLTNVGDWYSPDGASWKSGFADGLPAIITSFEVLSEPRNVTAKAVLDRVQQLTVDADGGRAWSVVAREFGVEL